MDSDQIQQVRQIVIEQLKNSNFKKFINYKETETICAESVDRDLALSGRVPKNQQNTLNEFREQLSDLISEKLGSEYAMKFIEEVFEVQVGLCENEKFQGLEAHDVNGNKVEIIHQHGQVLMIDFWATWCGYCQDPMQENVDLFNKNTNLKDRNISIVGLSCDENVGEWKSHVYERNWNVIPQYIKQGVLDQVGIRGIPCVAIIDRDGFIAYFGHPGGIHLEETLVNLSEGKVIKKRGESNSEDLNQWFNSMDTQTKMDIIAECNFVVKDSGVVSANFCVNTRYSLDPETFELKPIRNIPIFYGQVTQVEYEIVQNCAINLQTTYNFNDFDFKLRVTDGGDDDY